MYHTRESSNVPIFNQYCWNIPSAYENFTHRGSKLFFHFLLTTNINFIEHFNHRRSLSLPLDGLKGVERGKRKEFSFFIHRGLFSCDSSGIPGTRSDRFRWQTLLQTRWKKKYIFFPTGITKRYISIFLKRGTVSSREYGTLRHFRRFAKRCTMSIDVLPRQRLFPKDIDVAIFGWWERMRDSLMFDGCYNFL